MRRKTEKNSSLLARFLVLFIARPREISLLRRESNAIKGEAEIHSSAGKTSRKTFPHCWELSAQNRRTSLVAGGKWKEKRWAMENAFLSSNVFAPNCGFDKASTARKTFCPHSEKLFCLIKASTLPVESKVCADKHVIGVALVSHVAEVLFLPGLHFIKSHGSNESDCTRAASKLKVVPSNRLSEVKF